MSAENERGRPGKGGSPFVIADRDECNVTTAAKLPNPGTVPDYAAALECVHACSEGCPWTCPTLIGGVR